MNWTFSFYISAENHSFNFSLPVEYGNCVNATAFRHPDVCAFETGILRIPCKVSAAVPINDFKKDLDEFVNYLENLHKPLEFDMLYDALAFVCERHINHYGRLIYVDLLYYVDVYIYVDFAIFSCDEDLYRYRYKQAVYLILNRFPNHVLFYKRF